MTEKQRRAADDVGEMLSELVGALTVATSAGEGDEALHGLLGGMHRIARLAKDRWKIAIGAAVEGGSL